VTSWQEGAPLRTLHLGARAFIPVALAGAVLFSTAPTSPASAAITTEAQQIVKIARAQYGDPWRYGAIGPYSFDCSGLVIYAFKKAGDASVIRYPRIRTARAMYLNFKARGKASRTNPKIGDLVVWGYGSHIGIYIGNGKAISTLRSGVRIHGVFAVTARFTAYLHTGMSTKPVS
jgi:cell wall-associated NlpC family hydrolase